MLAVVKTPNISFEIEGHIPKKVINYLKHEYGTGFQLITENAIPISQTKWH